MTLTSMLTSPTDATATVNYQERTRGYPHQQDAQKAMAGKPFFALFADPGTGKSKMAIDRAGLLYTYGKISGALIVAPKGVHRQWADIQIPTHSGVSTNISTWAGRGKPLLPKRYHLQCACINYDGIKTKRGQLWLDQWIRQTGTYMLILDESHFIKNPRSQRWKAVRALRNRPECRAGLLLTGTPIAKNLVDEWAQLQVLDEGILKIKYVTHFRNRFCLMGGFEGREVIGTRDLDQYKEITAPYVYRASKANLDIPAKVYDEWTFSMAPRQSTMYHQMAEVFLAEIEKGDITTAANAAVKINKLQQISNGFIHDDVRGLISLFDDPMDNPRIKALCELLGSYQETQPTIIWCKYVQDIENITHYKVLRGEAVQLHGKMTAPSKAIALERWLMGDVPYLVATPGTGGTGLNLQEGGCTRAIYYSNSEHSLQRWQSEDRIHRIGTASKCLYTDLICTGSRDRAILRNLRGKRALLDMRLDEIADEVRAAIEDENGIIRTH